MRYYFAGAYARRAELAGYARGLELAGLGQVTSRWLDGQDEGDDAGLSVGNLVTPDAVRKAWTYGMADLADLTDAEAIVSFTGEGTRGGRHVEHGFALAWAATVGSGKDRDGMRLIVVGPREHVFHCAPATEVYPGFAAFLLHETDKKNREGDQ